MQSLQMLQAALTAAQPQVTQPTMVGQPQQGSQYPAGGGGNETARLGAMVSSVIGGGRGNRGGGINPTKNELELATLGGTEPLSQALLDAQNEYGMDRRTYEQTQQQRFSTQSGIGRSEQLFDLFRGKRAFKNMQESRNAYQVEAQDYQISQQKRILAAEMQRREDYVKNALPQYVANNPGVNHQAAVAFLTQAAAQNMPMEKILPNGPVQPTPETYIDTDPNSPSYQSEMTRFRAPNGQIMTGDKWEPFVSKGPTAKTTGEKTTKGKHYADGVEFDVTYGAPDATGALPILAMNPTGKNVDEKPFVQMSPENRKYGSMVANATNLVAQALPLLFDENGNWNSLEAITPMSKTKAALLAYKNAIRMSIRPESGAAVPESEVIAAEEMYLPKVTDSDFIAQSKVQRFAEYQKRMYNGMFDGFTGVPENLGFVDYMQPWMDTPVAQAASLMNQMDDADAEIDARLQAALKAAGID